MKGTLYLIPGLLGDTAPGRVLPPLVKETVGRLTHFIVEDTRTARRFLKKLDPDIQINVLTFYEIDKHAGEVSLLSSLRVLEEGIDMGLLSEAGMPAVADPGALLVREAHRRGIRVVPLVGPSSLLLALMASGMNGQRFNFHGYLPIRHQQRIQAIRQLENLSAKEDQTQIVMETPYRNASLLADFLSICQPSTLLCIAADITLPTEDIYTATIEEWRRKVPDINKRPAVFCLYRPV
jgi:16S rRNA (cytidine1402-2'-O)-methyltransferase